MARLSCEYFVYCFESYRLTFSVFTYWNCLDAFCFSTLVLTFTETTV